MLESKKPAVSNKLTQRVYQEKIREALSSFDDNDDGKVSFDEFSSWWHRDDVT
jgi:Ca2+-binding EF-hand superfamily protein